MSGLATPRSTRGNIVRASSSFASRAFEQATREEEAGADEKHGQAGKGMHGGDVDSHERLLQRTRQLLGPAGSGAEDASQERGGRSARAGMWARLMEEAAVHEAEEEEEEDEQGGLTAAAPVTRCNPLSKPKEYTVSAHIWQVYTCIFGSVVWQRVW